MGEKIRFANRDDIPAIMEFIDAHWKKDHILVRSREIFELTYCYYGEVGFALIEKNRKQ